MRDIVVAALAALAPVLTVILNARRAQHDRDRKAARAESRAKVQSKKLDRVHVVVNGRMDEALARIAALEQELALRQPIAPKEEEA